MPDRAGKSMTSWRRPRCSPEATNAAAAGSSSVSTRSASSEPDITATASTSASTAVDAPGSEVRTMLTGRASFTAIMYIGAV